MQRALPAALIVQKKWLAVAQHNIPRLEVPIQKIVVVGAQQKSRQSAEIVLQSLFVERDSGEPQKIILKIVQIPRDGLPVKAGARITDLVIQIAARLHLKARQHGHHFSICLNDLGSDDITRAVCTQKLEERRVPKIFFKVGALAQILAINLRNRQSVPPKMA